MKMRATVAVLFASLSAVIPARAATDALRLAGRTEMPGYTGDFDHFAYDLPSRRLWLAAEDHGSLDVFDLKTGALRKRLRGGVDTAHGGFYLPEEKRLNVTGRNEMAVVDKRDLKVITTWPIKEAEQNAPLAFDEEHRRLFVITRKPGKLIVLDANGGATVASFKAPERCDQVIWDAANR